MAWPNHSSKQFMLEVLVDKLEPYGDVVLWHAYEGEYPAGNKILLRFTGTWRTVDWIAAILKNNYKLSPIITYTGEFSKTPYRVVLH